MKHFNRRKFKATNVHPDNKEVWDKAFPEKAKQQANNAPPPSDIKDNVPTFEQCQQLMNLGYPQSYGQFYYREDRVIRWGAIPDGMVAPLASELANQLKHQVNFCRYNPQTETWDTVDKKYPTQAQCYAARLIHSLQSNINKTTFAIIPPTAPTHSEIIYAQMAGRGLRPDSQGDVLMPPEFGDRDMRPDLGNYQNTPLFVRAKEILLSFNMTEYDINLLPSDTVELDDLKLMPDEMRIAYLTIAANKPFIISKRNRGIYRPRARGYTDNPHEAGIYTLQQAYDETKRTSEKYNILFIKVKDGRQPSKQKDPPTPNDHSGFHFGEHKI